MGEEVREDRRGRNCRIVEGLGRAFETDDVEVDDDRHCDLGRVRRASWHA